MAFFSKGKNNSGGVNLFDLFSGSQFDYDAKTWTVGDITDCDWGDSESKVYDISSNGEKACLEVGIEDDELSITVTKQVPMSMLKGDVQAHIHQHDNAPQEVDMNGYIFFLADDYGGFCTNRNTGEKDEIYVWEYYDASENFILTIEQWGETEFEVAFGTVVKEHEINATNNSGGGRFS